MPQTTERFWDPNSKKMLTRTVGQNEGAQTQLKYGSTANTRLGAAGQSTAGMPKQDPGESLSAYSARIRKWRESQASSQASALAKSGSTDAANSMQ